jgi:ABC-2 type transport system ATP-binding protein
MIAIEGASARRVPLALSNVSLAFGPGVHSILGGRDGGAPLLLALIAGTARLRSGRVRVLDHPAGDAHVRPEVAWVPLAATLPEGLRVREVLRLAETLRGEAHRPPEERLAALGLEPLAARPVKSLSRGESRAVALAEAITSARVRVLLVEEPLLGVDPRAAARIPAALRARGRHGAAVMVATGSTDDAAILADDHTLLRAGNALGPALSIEALLGVAPDGARLHVVARSTADARRLVAALSGADGGGAIDAVEQDGPAVQARGRDPGAMARAIAQAAAAAHVDVLELRFGAPPIEALAAVLATAARAAPMAGATGATGAAPVAGATGATGAAPTVEAPALAASPIEKPLMEPPFDPPPTGAAP